VARPPLPLGSWGLIRTHAVKDRAGHIKRFRAVANFRDFDGKTRPVEAGGRTKTAAEQKLRRRLQTRSNAGGSGELTALTKFSDASQLWLESVSAKVEQGRRSPATLELYRLQLTNHVLPAMGGVRLGEVTTPLIDKVLNDIRKRVSAATAKTCRTVISGVLSSAVRQGAVMSNPVREADRIESTPKKSPRALSARERVTLLQQLQDDPVARRHDLPDLVFFMLATGVRIGEALAVIWSDVNLDAGTVEISSTLIRVRGEGLLRKGTKTRSGERLLALPASAVAVLRRRFMSGARLDQPLFPDIRGGFRDPANARRELRDARGDTELAWITSHTFRKTAATILDEAALSARLIADQLGHARPSMTQDVYLGRRAGDDQAARALDRALSGAALETEKHGKSMALPGNEPRPGAL
jgi:integrase